MRKAGFLLVALILSAATLPAEELNFAAAFGWQGHVETDLELSSFFANDHTILLRFLPQYTMIDEAPMVSVDGSGTFAIGLGSFTTGDNAVKLELAVGNSVALVHLGAPEDDGDPIPLKEEWHTLAAVYDGSKYKLYLDGKKLTPESGADLAPTAADMSSISGKLRLGSKDSGNSQFYGFLDDVAVFRKALTKDEMDEAFGRDRLKRQPDEHRLLRAWTFDSALPGGNALPPRFAHPVTFRAPAYKALVSQNRQSKIDAGFLPPPFHETRLTLPFARGEAWQVLHGNEGVLSHSGTGAFCWDFRKEGPHNPLDQIETCGTKVFSASAGTIIDGCDRGDPDSASKLETGCAKSASDFNEDGKLLDGYNEVYLEGKPGEIQLYLHIQTGSLREAFPNHASEFKSPVVSQPPLNIHIDAKSFVARAGTKGIGDNGKADNCHLHFSVGTPGSRTTFPTAFSNYEYFEETSVRWLPVDRGIPRKNQWVRRPPAPPSGNDDPEKPVSDTQCVCKGGHKAGPGVKAGSAACQHICRAYE